MGVYVTKWENLKKDFENKTNQARPRETVKKALIGTVAKSTGITPALKDVESALAKKERKTFAQALNKFEIQRNAYSKFLAEEQTHLDPATDEAVWKAYQSLIQGLHGIADEAAKDAKSVQEEKSPIEGIQFLAMEAELKNVVADAKKKLTPYAALEKKYGLLKKADAALKLAETYTKVAARTQVKAALDTLESLQKECKKCADELEKVVKLEKDQGFKTALESYRKSMADTGAWSRLLLQIKNLRDRLQAG